MSIYVTLASEAGDLALRSGRRGLLLATAGDKIATNIVQRLKVFQGEWFLDLTDGVSYYRDFFKKSPSIPVMRSVFRERINGTPGVLETVSIDMNLDRPLRKLATTFKARIAEPTSQGLLIINGTVSYLTDGSGNILTTGGDTLIF